MTANRGRVKGRAGRGGSMKSQSEISTGDQRQRSQAALAPANGTRTVMHSGVRPGRRGGAGRASRRGPGRGSATRSRSLFCCKGSSAKYSPIKRSPHRYVPTQEPVLPVWHTGGFEYHRGNRFVRAKTRAAVTGAAVNGRLPLLSVSHLQVLSFLKCCF